jgi:predicted nicotinamide N-methyase
MSVAHAYDETAEFVERNTRLDRAPLVPELRLRLAAEAIALWELTESEFEAKGLPPPYWAFAWAGGQALARYVLDRRGLVSGRTVLDFAAGSGIAGIAAARAGALSVLCADIDPFAAAACAINGALNRVAIHTTTDDLVGGDLVPDVVLAGDIFYEGPMSGRVHAWLKALAAQGALVLVGDPGRTYLPKSGLARLAEYDVVVSRDLEDRELSRTVVYRVAG